jgi:hypothetical protein
VCVKTSDSSHTLRVSRTPSLINIRFG